MDIVQKSIELKTNGQGMYQITRELETFLQSSGLEEGMLTVFCQHTSCSMMIMENADPTAQRDLEYYLNKLVPEGDPGFQHTLEGPDDMPSHIKMALTRTSEQIPFSSGHLCLGTWQGVFLWEHRKAPHRRRIILSCVGR